MNKNNDTKRQNTMKTQTTKTHLALYASGILTCFSGTAGATIIFTEDFNSFTGVLKEVPRRHQIMISPWSLTPCIQKLQWVP